MKIFNKLAISAIALAASASIASATCLSGCTGDGLTFGGSTYFDGVTGGMFAAPDSGSGMIDSTKDGGSTITADIVDGGFCAGPDCASITLNGSAMAFENGSTTGNAEGAESNEAVTISTGGLFAAGSALMLTYGGDSSTVMATGGALFENAGGGIFAGDTGGVHVTSYGSGGVDTNVGFEGSVCDADCRNVTGGASASGTAGMTVDAFGATTLSGFEAFVQNGGSSLVTVGTGTGVMTGSSQ
jgi:hypothetical protein